MDASISLPKIANAEVVLQELAAFEKREENEDKWQSLCISAISFGTDYDLLPCLETKSDDAVAKKRSTMSLKIRAQKTLEFLSEVLDKETVKKSLYDENDASSRANPYHILIDLFWLVSNILVKETKAAKEKKDDEASMTHQEEALSIIIKGLASKLPPMFTQRLQMTLSANVLNKFKLVDGNFLPRARKYATNVLYRQKKFNLLVEESEGYSKLLIFLFSQEQLIQEEQNGNVMRIIQELMGTFYLDPNRVLDLVLLVLESYLQKIELEEQSSKVLSILLDVLREFKRETLPQLMGFKLSSLHSSEGEQGQNESLYLTCAYLICHNLIQLEDLVPHLQSSITEIDKMYKANRKMETKKLRKLGAISLNAANADKAGGTEGNKPSDASPIENAESLFCENQVISIFESLIHFQAWNKVYAAAHLFVPSSTTTKNPAIYLLSQACSISSNFAGVILETINHIIEPVYETNIRSKNTFFASMKQSNLKDDDNKKTNRYKKISALIPNLATINQVENILDLIEKLYIPLVVITDSGCIQKDPTLYSKLCRLFKGLLSRQKLTFEDIDPRLLVILQIFLVPSLSLFPSNPCVSSELWSCVSELDYTLRYVLYDTWRGNQLEKRALRIGVPPPTISPQSAKSLARVESEIRTGIECRYVLKRLSNKNALDSGRHLAKTSHNNPIVVFTLVLNQIETYDNLIELMVDSFKFSTKLSLDVLAYCLLVSLGGGAKKTGRMKSASDGMGTTQWLSSLSQFTGALFKKFPDVEIRGIVSHLIGELRCGRTSELPVLRNLLTNAGGYDFADCDSISSLSQAQLEGRSGSQRLKRETSSFGIVESYSKISSAKLREVIQDKSIGLPLLILLAQVKEKIMYESNESQKQYLKVIGKLHDSCHALLGLLLEFLTDLNEDQSMISNYASMLPTLSELTQDYKVSPVIAWMLCRPLVRSAISHALKKKKAEEEGEEKEDFGGKKANTSSKNLSIMYHPSSDDMLSTYKDLVPTSNWKYITPTLYGYFWSLSLYDIHCPESRYTTEQNRLSNQMKKLILGKLQKRDVSYNISMAAIDEEEKRRKFESNRIKNRALALVADQDTQKSHTQMIRSLFQEKKQILFPKLEGQNQTEEDYCFHLISTCTYPRCTVSPEDAMYCAKFVEMLHDFGTQGFDTLKYLDQLISVICGSLFCITEDEAGNIGILLRETWTKISEWRYDEKMYEEEVSSKSATSTSFLDYVTLYNKWHLSIGVSLMGCLQSKEYIHVRAAIVVLSRVVDVYPTRPRLGQKLIKQLVPLTEDNNRPDIKVMANAYAAQLEKARKEGVWKEQDASEANKIMEEDKLKAEEKKKEAERKFEEMKKENEQFDRTQGQKRFGDKSYRGGGNRHDSQPQPQPQPPPSGAVFTPPNNGAPRSLNNNPREQSYRHRERDWDRHRDRNRDHRGERSKQFQQYSESSSGTRAPQDSGTKRDRSERVESKRDGPRVVERDGHTSKRTRVSSAPERRGNTSSQGGSSGRGQTGRTQRNR